MFKFFSKTEKSVVDAVNQAAQAVEQAHDEVNAAATEEFPSIGSKPASGTFRIKVNGKVVFEGKSGSVKIEQNSQVFNNGYNQTIINGVKCSGDVIAISGSQGIDVTIEGDVHGDVDTGMALTCGNVKGNVDSGMNVTCGDVGGDIDAGMNVTCGNVTGDVDAGMNVKMRK